jgi:SNF2 family DNA or RNA helicase
MKPLQAQIYSAVQSTMRQQIAMSARDRVQFAQLVDVVMYLIEAATNPALLANALGGARSATAWPPSPIPLDSSLVHQVCNYGSYEMPRKFEMLTTMVAENAALGRKTLVWSNFRANLEELATRVLSPYQPALIYGGIPSSQKDETFRTRETELRRFRNDDSCMVLLANPAAMSEGVSLHKECHDAIYLDRTFNAGQYLQSIDRIHRLGLAPGVETRITFLQSSGTIDEVVDRRVRLKADRLSQLLSDPDLVVMALPEPGDYGEWVQTSDLNSLFAHLEGA